jgi:assimilatory nitrate reductase catalytic subunit
VYQRIVQAKKDNPALKIVVVDPRKTATCDMADLHLPLKPGSDASLFNGLLTHLVAQDLVDKDFIDNHVEGFSQAIATAKSTTGDLAQVAAITEIAEADLTAFF